MKFKMAQSNRQSGAPPPSVKQEEGSPHLCFMVQGDSDGRKPILNGAHILPLSSVWSSTAQMV